MQEHPHTPQLQLLDQMAGYVLHALDRLGDTRRAALRQHEPALTLYGAVEP